MNQMLYQMGYNFYVTDISTSNMCIIVGLDKGYKRDYNNYNSKPIWETKILKSVWGQPVGMFY